MSKVAAIALLVVWPWVAGATNTWYFACTATDLYGLESDYSEEVVYESRARYCRVILAWNACDATNQVDHYSLYYGTSSRTYTNRTDVYNALQVTVATWPALTNCEVAIMGECLERATNLAGPWVPAERVCLTNPVEAVMFFRGAAAGIGARRFGGP